MKILEKLKSDKKLLLIVIALVIGVFTVPYLTIPALFLWWFYKKSKFSKRFKTISTISIVGLFTILMTFAIIAYAKDVEPHLKVNEPPETTSIKASQIGIRGTYDPADRKVWINGKDIKASNG